MEYIVPSPSISSIIKNRTAQIGGNGNCIIASVKTEIFKKVHLHGASVESYTVHLLYKHGTDNMDSNLNFSKILG